MTRSHKYNDRNHAGLADGTAVPVEHLPRFFAKHGFADADPKKTKKNGSGKGNWGEPGDEVIDDDEFTFSKMRRRSNSFSYTPGAKDLRSKFDVNEPEPVFEESVHGPVSTEDENEVGKDSELTKTDSVSSEGSLDEDKSAKTA